ncbi:NmrA family NAD(P)-binding protein [Actinocatenispora sera]|uniref:Nucleotide-diphosphate-sugar epimerase n=1 Tax=Actinocatenispora sera TaxID=390989 RepID=A0A810L8J4_9ACTN|nr:NmrA family NAD(P)-binding protein [Actinocatenispora sera]BCJ31870.1 nucleotide-diphosphate-sugar epimerase [Actinocatenispora sera]
MFLLPGYADMPGLLDLIARSHVQRVVLLSGPSAGSGDLNNAVTAYLVASEQAVRDSNLPFTILRPSGFMSNTLQWAPQLAAGDTVRAPFASAGVAMIDPADIASVATLALADSRHEGHTYRFTGPHTLLPADRVRVLAEVLGRPLRFEAQPDDEAREEMTAIMPPQYVAAFFDFYAAGALDDSAVLPTFEELTGRPPRTFRQWAETHRDAFA